MAAPTSLDVSVDNDEFSRYESGRETITATVVAVGGAPYSGEEVTVDLVKARRSRDAVVASATLTFDGTADPQEGTVTFFLPDIVDQDMIHLVRHGKYFVRATSVSDEDVVGESEEFHISIVSVDRLRNDFLFGIPMIATGILEPKFQPSLITGITVAEISAGHPIGPVVLNYIYHVDDVTDATVDIGSGTDGVVSITADEDNAGSDGNGFTAEVVIPTGTSGLSVLVTNNELVISLAVIAGVPDAAANTATLVAAAVDTLDGFSAEASGTGATALSAEEGPTQFSGGTSNVVRQLSWDGGPLVSLKSSGTVVLPSGGDSCGPSKFNMKSSEYIVIRVRSISLLPTENTVETLIIDRQMFDDESLRKFLCQATAWVEKDFLATPVEPTNVVTDRDPTTVQFAAGINAPAPLFTDTDYDDLVTPLTYYPNKGATWVDIQFPWPQILRIDSLFGAIANTRVIDVDLEWIAISQHGGLVQLVPYNQEIAFDFVGLIWVNAIRGAASLPNFWHYNAIVGLREASCDVQELIAKKAAIDALTVLGMALRPGVGSVSLSRDGVSESVSYVTGSKYGVYTGQIQAYKDWIDEQGKLLRAKYRGVTMCVV
jgi:hypothetical protein